MREHGDRKEEEPNELTDQGEREGRRENLWKRVLSTGANKGWDELPSQQFLCLQRLSRPAIIQRLPKFPTTGSFPSLQPYTDYPGLRLRKDFLVRTKELEMTGFCLHGHSSPYEIPYLAGHRPAHSNLVWGSYKNFPDQRPCKDFLIRTGQLSMMESLYPRRFSGSYKDFLGSIPSTGLYANCSLYVQGKWIGNI